MKVKFFLNLFFSVSILLIEPVQASPFFDYYGSIQFIEKDSKSSSEKKADMTSLLFQSLPELSTNSDLAPEFYLLLVRASRILTKDVHRQNYLAGELVSDATHIQKTLNEMLHGIQEQYKNEIDQIIEKMDEKFDQKKDISEIWDCLPVWQEPTDIHSQLEPSVSDLSIPDVITSLKNDAKTFYPQLFDETLSNFTSPDLTSSNLVLEKFRRLIELGTQLKNSKSQEYLNIFTKIQDFTYLPGTKALANLMISNHSDLLTKEEKTRLFLISENPYVQDISPYHRGIHFSPLTQDAAAIDKISILFENFFNLKKKLLATLHSSKSEEQFAMIKTLVSMNENADIEITKMESRLYRANKDYFQGISNAILIQEIDQLYAEINAREIAARLLRETALIEKLPVEDQLRLTKLFFDSENHLDSLNDWHDTIAPNLPNNFFNLNENNLYLLQISQSYSDNSPAKLIFELAKYVSKSGSRSNNARKQSYSLKNKINAYEFAIQFLSITKTLRDDRIKHSIFQVMSEDIMKPAKEKGTWSLPERHWILYPVNQKIQKGNRCKNNCNAIISSMQEADDLLQNQPYFKRFIEFLSAEGKRLQPPSKSDMAAQSSRSSSPMSVWSQSNIENAIEPISTTSDEKKEKFMKRDPDEEKRLHPITKKRRKSGHES